MTTGKRPIATDGWKLLSSNATKRLSLAAWPSGVGVCHVGLAKRDPSLVRVLAKEFAPVLDTWIAMHEDLRESTRCAVTFAALVAGLKGYIAGS